MNIFRKVIRILRPIPVVGLFPRILTSCYRGFLWHLEVSEGHRYLKQAYGGRFRHSKPLRIDALKIFELHPSPKAGMSQYNPTLLCQSGGLRIIWRISNWQTNPFVTFFGDRKSNPGLTPFPLVNRVGAGFVPTLRGEISQRIEGEELILGLEQDLIPKETQKKWDTDGFLEVYSYEDPRALPSDPTILTLTAVQQGRKQGGIIINAAVSLYDLDRQEIVLLNIPDLRVHEKNWVLVAVAAERVTFLRQSEPPHLIVVDRRSGQMITQRIGKPTGKRFLHGGSSFVLVDGSFYLRVARHRISLRGVRKLHISHIVKHDLDFNEIYRSQPFVFRNYGFEICNGLDYDGSHFYFSWGENDTKMFAASIEKENLLNWLAAHEEVQINPS